MKYMTRSRDCIETNDTRLVKLHEIKEFMFDEFYQKRTNKK